MGPLPGPRYGRRERDGAMSDRVIFTLADDRVVEFEVDRATADEIDKKLHWATSTVIYFVRFTDVGGLERRVNLARVAWVTIRRDFVRPDVAGSQP